MPEKFEKEIDEIMRQSGDLTPRQSMGQLFKDAQHRFKEGIGLELFRLLRWLTPTKAGFTGALVLVVALVMRSPPIAILGLGLLLGAYFLAVIRGGRTFEETTGSGKSWRGRPIDDSPGGPERPPAKRGLFRRWFGRKG